MMEIDNCILYRDFEHGGLLEDMARLMKNKDRAQGRSSVFYHCVHQLIEMAEYYGFSGNLWHDYLTYLLVNKENPYSMACEVVGKVEGTINHAAEHDLKIFKELFDYDLFHLECDEEDIRMITQYESCNKDNILISHRVRDRILELSVRLSHSENVHEFMEHLTQFYKTTGTGKLGLHKAFRVEIKETGAKIVPITRTAGADLDDIIGYEIPKQQLIENTEAFVEGRKANNCLLFGDAGTGKSSCIKGILNRYYDQGLRIIEIYKHQFQALNDVIAQIKNRNYKFIIYMDDLSFEEFEIEYKYLKAVIEGGLEKKPDNILIYATSNRRHLIRENFSDKEDGEDIHRSDTVQEKLSLVSRFGVTIYFGSPDKKQFHNIVRSLSERHGISIPEKELLEEADRWELRHGGLSGRTAQQFIDYLCGKINKGGE